MQYEKIAYIKIGHLYIKFELNGIIFVKFMIKN